MVKSGVIKSVILLAFIGIIVVTSVEPIAAQMMGEHSANENDHAQMFAEAKQIINAHMSCDKLTDDQFKALGEYYMEQMHPGEAHERMDNMIKNMMGEQGLRQMHINMGRMMYCGMGGGGMMGRGMMGRGMMGGGMMGGHTANETIVQPISGNQSANETMTYCVTNNLSANETMMYCVTGNYSTLARLDCARFWLKKAIELHKVHLKDPSTATNESQMEMMDQMMRAYDCVTGENMTTGMVNTTGSNVS